MNANTISFIIYCLTAGMFIAFVWSIITKAVYGKFIEALIKSESNTPEKAKTLKELGIKDNFLLNHALKKNNTLIRLIKEEEGRYHLPDENEPKAQSIYGREKITPFTIIIILLLLFIVIMVCKYVIPYIF